MRQDEINSLFRMKLIRSQSAAHTASRGPLTHEDGVRQSDLKARVGGGPFSFYERLKCDYLTVARQCSISPSASWRALERTSTVGKT
jgi:hypothetical protein